MRFIEEYDLQSLIDAAGKDIKHQFLREQPTGKRIFMPFLLNTLVLLNHKFGKCKKSASVQIVGWQNVQIVVAERLLMLEPSALSSKVL